MTTEEAIEILSDVGDINRCCAEDAEALDMAIKALKQEPCEDCISRKDVLAMKRLFVDEDGVMAYAVPTGNILRLRPVTPKYTDEEIDKAQAVEQAYVDKMVELAVKETKRPKGKWIVCDVVKFGDFVGTEKYECSECHHRVGAFISTFCPNCGARMAESED